MASELQPHSVLTVDTASGFRYTTHYQHPTDEDKPYILFVHGFPSSAYDWRKQVPHFASQGYGIIAPDTLGYGGSSKPLEPGDYTLKAIADSIIEVVDAVAGAQAKVLGVGHDWYVSLRIRLRESPGRVLMGRKGVLRYCHGLRSSTRGGSCAMLFWLGSSALGATLI